MIRRGFIVALVCSVPGAAAAQNVTEVQVAPPTVTIRVGERSGLLATAFDRIGNVIPTVRIIWSSININVAKVDNNGTVTGVANGVAIVDADGRVAPIFQAEGQEESEEESRQEEGAAEGTEEDGEEEEKGNQEETPPLTRFAMTPAGASR